MWHFSENAKQVKYKWSQQDGHTPLVERCVAWFKKDENDTSRFDGLGWAFGQFCGWHSAVTLAVMQVLGATALEWRRCRVLNTRFLADAVAASLSKCMPMDWYFNGWGTEIESYFS